MRKYRIAFVHASKQWIKGMVEIEADSKTEAQETVKGMFACRITINSIELIK
jgi:hypothetical protein